MKIEQIFLNQRKTNVQQKFNQMMLTLITLLLWISPGLGDDKPPDCKARDPEFCSSPCNYLKDKCNGNKGCTFDLCLYLYPRLTSQDLERCLDLPLDCTNEFRYPSKRGILNKNVAYLLLKLHPFFNQTSQFGFLTSGRFRRITGNFGTEFLGKRSNNKLAGSRPSGSSGRENQNLQKPKPTPMFYSLPLNKFSKTKILKRGDDFDADSREKRLSIRGNGKILLGSEFLGKRGFYQNERMKRLTGNEFLGKRNDDPFDGSEFLGKRIEDSGLNGDFSGKRPRDPLDGNELLGKKSSQEANEEIQVKRFGNELLGKRQRQEVNPRRNFFNKKDSEFGFWPDYDPELIDEAFSSYESTQSPKIPIGSNFCSENESGTCRGLKIE